MPLRVLLLENDADDCAVVCVFLRASSPRFNDLDVQVVHTWRAARVKIVLHPWDVIVMNHCLTDAAATSMLEALRDLPHAPVVVLTPLGSLDTGVRLLRAGADEAVMKHLEDWDVELRMAIERLAACAGVQRSLEDAKAGLRDYAAALAGSLTRQRAPWATRVFPVPGAPLPAEPVGRTTTNASASPLHLVGPPRGGLLVAR